MLARGMMHVVRRGYAAYSSFFEKSSSHVMGKGKNVVDPFVNPLTPNNVGDDSYYLVKDTNFWSMGVADGVGGWSVEPNGRPDLVAQHFMKHCENVAKQYQGNARRYPPMHLTPAVGSQIIFAQAYERLQQNPPGLGSTTGVVFVRVYPYMTIVLLTFGGDGRILCLLKKGSLLEVDIVWEIQGILF